MTIPQKRRLVKPHTIVLHHTGGGSASGAIATLKARGLGYHYIIDRKGVITKLVDPKYKTYHAYGANTGTVGVSYVGGGKFGPVTQEQITASTALLRRIVEAHPSIKYLTGHKHIDKRGWKIDPRFLGEPENGINLDIDSMYMTTMARETGLIFLDKNHYRRKQRGY